MPSSPKKVSFLSANNISFLILGLVLFVLYFIIKDYLVVLISSVIFCILIYPIYKQVNKSLHVFTSWLFSLIKKVFKRKQLEYKPEKFEKVYNNFSAIFTLILVISSIIIIFNLLIGIFSRDFKRILVDAKTESQSLLQNESAKKTITGIGLSPEKLNSDLNTAITFIEERKLPDEVKNTNFSDLYNSDTYKQIQNSLLQVGRSLVNSIISFIFNTIIFLISSFFFLIQGKQILKRFYFFLPFTESEEELLSKDTVLAVKNVIIGNILSGLLNAVAVYLICFVFQLPYTLLIVLVAFIVGFLPLSPSEFAYITPVLLVYNKNPGATFLVAFLAEIYILFLNYIVVPKVIASSNVSPLLILLATFAFIGLFGIMGFIIGPIVVYIVFSLLKILEERKKELEGVV